MKFHMDGGLKEQSAVETEMTRMGDNGWWLSMVVLGGYVSAYCWSMFEEYTNPTNILPTSCKLKCFRVAFFSSLWTVVMYNCLIVGL